MQFRDRIRIAQNFVEKIDSNLYEIYLREKASGVSVHLVSFMWRVPRSWILYTKVVICHLQECTPFVRMQRSWGCVSTVRE